MKFLQSYIMKLITNFFKHSTVQSLLYFMVAIVLWQVATHLESYSDLFFPKPIQVVNFLWEGFFSNGTLWGAIIISLERLIIGYFFSILIGIPLGILCTYSNFLKNTLRKLALGFQTLPSICWVPLTLLWFGQTSTAIIFVVIMGSIWSLMLGAEQSIKRVPEIYVRAATTMGARKFTLFRTVIFPAIIPTLVLSMKHSWAFAWRSLMSAEIYISTINGLGLGQLLHYGREMQAMDQVVSIICILTLIGLVIEYYLFLPIEKFIEKRWGK